MHYRPHSEGCGKVMFSQVSVHPQMVGGGGGTAASGPRSLLAGYPSLLSLVLYGNLWEREVLLWTEPRDTPATIGGTPHPLARIRIPLTRIGVPPRQNGSSP